MACWRRYVDGCLYGSPPQGRCLDLPVAHWPLRSQQRPQLHPLAEVAIRLRKGARLKVGHKNPKLF